jgi:pyruvate kinase
LALVWGVIPILDDKKENADELILDAIKKAKESGLAEQGDRVVVTSGVIPHIEGATNIIKAYVM